MPRQQYHTKSEHELRLLRSLFAENPYPLPEEKDLLHDQLHGSLTKTQITQWFVDERNRVKRRLANAGVVHVGAEVQHDEQNLMVRAEGEQEEMVEKNFIQQLEEAPGPSKQVIAGTSRFVHPDALLIPMVYGKDSAAAYEIDLTLCLGQKADKKGKGF